MQVIGHARSSAFADVDPDVEPLGFRDLPQQLLPPHDQGKKLGHFIFTEIAQLAHFSIWHRHQVSNSVGITIHIRKEFFLRTRTKWARYAQLRQHEPASLGAIAIPGITPSGTPRPSENLLVRVEQALPIETPASTPPPPLPLKGTKPTPA